MVVLWLVLCYFWYGRSIKDAVSFETETEAEAETEELWKTSVSED